MNKAFCSVGGLPLVMVKAYQSSIPVHCVQCVHDHTQFNATLYSLSH